MGPIEDNHRLIESTVPAVLNPPSTGNQMLETNSSMELATLSDIARIMSRVVSFDEKASQVVERLALVSEADWVGLRIPDERLLGMRLVASAGY